MFQTFLLSLLLVFGLCMAVVTLAVFDVVVYPSQLGPWITAPGDPLYIAGSVLGYYALFTGLVFALIVFSSDDSSEPGRSEAGTPRAVDAADHIYELAPISE